MTVFKKLEWASLVNMTFISLGYNCPMWTKKKRCALFSSVDIGYFILFASLCYASKTCTWMPWLRLRSLDHHLLTMAPFISLNTTPLKIIGEFGSDRSSGSKRQPSCLNQNSSVISTFHNDLTTTCMCRWPGCFKSQNSKWCFLLI